MSLEQQQLEAAIAALEGQRSLLGDAVVEPLLAAARARLDALRSAVEAEPTQALKQVSIVFLDVVGSTTLSQQLDPEATSAVMDGALARASALVEGHQGKVLQYAGDNLLAVFGAGDAREDDAERAVRCGLTLLALGAVLGREVESAHGHAGFNVRVGIHTGGVLLGGGVDAEGTIRGMAVNIAARMEQTAPAGALRISHDTYALVRGMFDVEPQPALQVKGIDEPVQSYLVVRAKPRSFHIGTRGIEGVATRMVGRDAEFAQLQQAFARLFVAKQLVMVTVVAEAGIGKSRLLHEFEAWSEARPESFYLFRGRATPQTQSQPFGLLRDILAWRLQIADDDTLDAARAKIEQGIVPLFVHSDGADVAEGHAHVLGHLLGIDFGDSRHVKGIVDDSRQIRNRALHAAAQVFRKVCAGDGHPIVLQLEDLHWADDGTLDFLSDLCEVNRDVPMLVLALTRPALFERRSDWGRGVHQRLDLHPLGAEASRRLAGELLKSLPRAPAAVSELVARRAEGNPFYMEELVKMLVDQGAIATGGARWTLHPEKLLATQIPASLTGVLQARLDSLPGPERLALQEASVIGQVFWDQALAALDARALAALPALTRRGLTPPRLDAAVEGMREYEFSHQILHEVTYATVLRRAKRALHARAAAFLSGLSGARASDFLAATAEHFELAGDSANACEYFARAAEHAKARYAHDVALRHAARAIALLDRDSALAEGAAGLALRWRVLVVREYALNLQGHRAEQRATLDALHRVADALDDDSRRAFAARRQSLLAMRTADHRAQQVVAAQAMAFAERAGDVASKLEAQRLLADALGALGELAAGEALARDGLAEARARGLRRVECVFLNALSYIASLRDDQVTGLSLDLQDQAIWRELGDPQGEAIALSNVGGDWLWFGELDKARQCLEDALRLSRTAGARSLECGPLGDLSHTLLRQGDAAQALAVARQALDTAVHVQARDFEAQSLCRVGEAELALNNHEAAAAAFERAEAVAAAIGHGVEHDALAGRARVALAASDIAGAMVFVERLLARAAGPDALEGADAKRILLTCHQVLAAAGDPRAAAPLERAHALLQSRAATIDDPALRASFLDRIAEHREIVAAWRHERGHGAGQA